MDPLSFLTPSFILFSLFIMAIMYMLRTSLEYFLPSVKTNGFWNDFLLLTLPIVIGCVLGYVFKAYPYGTGFTANSTHSIYGSVAGLLSTLIFKLINGLLGAKINGAVSNISSLWTSFTSSNGFMNPPQPPMPVVSPMPLPQPPMPPAPTPVAPVAQQTQTNEANPIDEANKKA